MTNKSFSIQTQTARSTRAFMQCASCGYSNVYAAMCIMQCVEYSNVLNVARESVSCG